MIKGEKEVGQGSEENEKICHWTFDLTLRGPRGGYTSAYNLEAESGDLIPPQATNIRPIHVGSVVQETYNLADPDHPIPIRKIHIHKPEGESRVLSEVGSFRFPWTTTKDVPMSRKDSRKFKKAHPIPSY